MAWTCPEKVVWMRFSPSGLLLATTSQETVYGEEPSVHRLWDALSGRELAHLEEPDILRAQAFASERALVIFGEQGCRFWNAESGVVKTISRACCNGGTAIPGPKPLAVCMLSDLLILNLPSGKVRHRLLRPLSSSVYGNEMEVSGRYLAACCRGQDEFGYQEIRVALWDVEHGKRLRTYEIEGGKVRWDDWPSVVVAIHPEGILVALATTKVQSFGLDWEDPLEGFKPFACKKVHDLRYTTDGRSLLVLGDNQLVRLDALTGQVLSRFKVPSSLAWDRGVIDPNGEKVAVAAGQEIEVLDILDV